MPRFASVVALVLLLLGSTAADAFQDSVDRKTEMLWSTNIVPLVQSVPPDISHFSDDSHIVVLQDSGSIVSLDPNTGAVQWTYTGLNSTGQIINQIHVNRDVVVIYANSIVTLNITSGAALWSMNNFYPVGVL